MSTPAPLSCRDAMTLLLADADAVPAEDLRRARVHAARCPACASALDDPGAPARVGDALAPRHPGSTRALRVVLAVVATAQLVVALPWLFGVSLVPGDVAVAHLTRDGALGLAIGVLGLLVVWRPRYAVVALMVGCVVFLVQSTTMVFDEQGNSVSLAFEITHLLVFANLALIGILSSTSRVRGPDVTRTPRAPRTVRSA